jgi:hypothetical protein
MNQPEYGYGRPYTTRDYGFGVKFGGPVEILDINRDAARTGISSLAASLGGGRMVFVDQSVEEPTPSEGYIDYEVFMASGGKVEQITNLKTHALDLSISRDGSKAVLLADDTRKARFDIFVIDVNDRSVQPTGIRSYLLEQETKRQGEEAA